MTPDEITAIVRRGVPLAEAMGVEVLSAADGAAAVRLPRSPLVLRPGVSFDEINRSGGKGFRIGTNAVRRAAYARVSELSGVAIDPVSGSLVIGAPCTLPASATCITSRE